MPSKNSIKVNAAYWLILNEYTANAIVNNMTGVKAGFNLPLPSFTLIFFCLHCFNAETPVPLSINYLYCLCSDLHSPVRHLHGWCEAGMSNPLPQRIQQLYIIRNTKKSCNNNNNNKKKNSSYTLVAVQTFSLQDEELWSKACFQM